MKQTNNQHYLTVGLFVIVLIVALIWLILWFSAGGGNGLKPAKTYYIYTIESVSGLNIDSPVRYRGVNVGKVTQIDLMPKQPDKVRLTINIDHQTPVKQDTFAMLEFQGLTGIANINLSGGSADAPELKKQAGEDYPVIRSRPSLLVRLDSELSGLLGQVEQTAMKFNQVMNDENQAHVGDILNATNTLLTGVAEETKHIQSTIKHLKETASNSEQITQVMNETFPELMTSFANSAEALSDMAQSLDQAGETLHETGSSLNQSLATVGQDLAAFTSEALPEVSELVDELRLAVENIHDTSEQIKQNPSVLIYGTNPPEKGPGE